MRVRGRLLAWREKPLMGRVHEMTSEPLPGRPVLSQHWPLGTVHMPERIVPPGLNAPGVHVGPP